jgi:thioredoxin-dependent peroxiredoxin
MINKKEGNVSSMNKERPGAVTIQGNPQTLVGPLLTVGETAPDFNVVNVALKSLTLNDLKGGIKIFSVIPSLDTPICATQAKRFSDESSSLEGVRCYTVSMDLPFAQDRWCTLSKVDSFYMLSDHRDASFGKAYGVLIKDLRLLSRAVFIVDEGNILRYVEYCDEIYSHVDYTSSLEAASRLAENTK